MARTKGKPTSAQIADAIFDNMERSKLTRFDVHVEDSHGKPIITMPGVVAQTRSEAINRVKQMFTYSAERAL